MTAKPASTGYQPGSTGLLSPIDHILADDQVSEILINEPERAWVEKNGKMQAHNISAFTQRHLQSICQLLANENGKRLSEDAPIMNGSLEDGSRVQIVMPPVTEYPSLSIRRKVVRHMALEDYVANGFFEQTQGISIPPSQADDPALLSREDSVLIRLFKQGNWARFLRYAIRFKKNIVVSGGTSSGKTTFLDMCLKEIDPTARILVLEDTRELQAPHANQLRLLATGEQSKAKVSMQDLVQESLRLRPDRILIGEVRGKEIIDFVAASATGHEGSMTSIHANNPNIAFMRMRQMYKLNNVPSMSDADIMNELQTVVDVIIQLNKTPAGRICSSIHYKYGYLPLSDLNQFPHHHKRINREERHHGKI